MIEYLNLERLFVYELAGTQTIFLFLALIVIFFFCAKFKFPNYVTLLICVVFIIFISPFNKFLYYLTIFLVGVFFSFQIHKFLSR